jgi:hypothetical protein
LRNPWYNHNPNFLVISLNRYVVEPFRWACGRLVARMEEVVLLPTENVMDPRILINTYPVSIVLQYISGLERNDPLRLSLNWQMESSLNI